MIKKTTRTHISTFMKQKQKTSKMIFSCFLHFNLMIHYLKPATSLASIIWTKQEFLSKVLKDPFGMKLLPIKIKKYKEIQLTENRLQT